MLCWRQFRLSRLWGGGGGGGGRPPPSLILQKCVTHQVPLNLNGMGFGGMGVNSTPSLFPLFKGQLKQCLVVLKYVTNCIQNHNKSDDVITGPL